MYLWRAVDRDGEVRDVLMQSRRDKRAALKLVRKLSKKRRCRPRTPVTDKWRACAAATRKPSLPACRHRGRWNNSRIENAHHPVRRRERKMQGLKNHPALSKRFLSVPAVVQNHFNTRRHLISASEHRMNRDRALDAWCLVPNAA